MSTSAGTPPSRPPARRPAPPDHAPPPPDRHRPRPPDRAASRCPAPRLRQRRRRDQGLRQRRQARQDLHAARATPTRSPTCRPTSTSTPTAATILRRAQLGGGRPRAAARPTRRRRAGRRRRPAAAPPAAARRAAARPAAPTPPRPARRPTRCRAPPTPSAPRSQKAVANGDAPVKLDGRPIYAGRPRRRQDQRPRPTSPAPLLAILALLAVGGARRSPPSEPDALSTVAAPPDARLLSRRGRGARPPRRARARAAVRRGAGRRAHRRRPARRRRPAARARRPRSRSRSTSSAACWPALAALAAARARRGAACDRAVRRAGGPHRGLDHLGRRALRRLARGQPDVRLLDGLRGRRDPRAHASARWGAAARRDLLAAIDGHRPMGAC